MGTQAGNGSLNPLFMKRIFLFLSLLYVGILHAQYPIFKSSFSNNNGYQYGWQNSGDSLLQVKTNLIQCYKPFLPKAYTTSSLPTGIPVGSIVGNSDSSGKPAYYDGSTYHYLSGAGGGGSSNAFIQNGNGFGAAAVLGTTDNNPLIFHVNNIQVGEFYTSGNFALGNGSGGDPGVLFFANGSSKWGGSMTISSNGGFSIINGANFSSFASNSSSNNTGWYWGMNNPYSSGDKLFFTIAGDVSFSSGTSSINEINIIPTINSSGSGTYTVRGIRFNPTNTSLTNTTVIAYENVTGNNLFNSTSGTSTFSNDAIFQAHRIGSTTAPSIAAGTGAGTSPTISITGNDQDGIITVTSGTLPAGSGATIVTVTYNTTFPTNSFVSMTPADASSALLSGVTMVFVTASTSGFTIKSGTTGLGASTTFQWYYHVGGN